MRSRIVRIGPLAKRHRARRLRPELSADQRHARELGRAWNWGRSYSARGWVRRPPPRYRSQGPRDDAGIALSAAFYRGYDTQTRATQRRRYRQPAAAIWPIRARAA